LVKAAVDSGRIAAKDENTSKYWRDQLIEASHDADRLASVSAALNAIPASDDITKKIVTVAGGQANSGDKDARQKSALIQAKKDLPDKTFLEQFAHAQTDVDPLAFED
jgi:hypothetical protein